MHRISYNMPVKCDVPALAYKQTEDAFFVGFVLGQIREQVASGKKPVLKRIFGDFRNATGIETADVTLYQCWQRYIEPQI